MSTLQHYIQQLVDHYSQLPSDPKIEKVGIRELHLSDGANSYVLRATRDPQPICRAFTRLSRLRSMGFDSHVPILPTRDGKPVLNWGRSHCYLEPYYPVADLDDESVILRLTATLAELHRLTARENGEGVLTHSLIQPEAVRHNAAGEILLSHWMHAQRSKSGATDVADVLASLPDAARRDIAKILHLYINAARLSEGETKRLLGELEDHGADHLGDLSIALFRRSPREHRIVEDSLLTGARTAAARGKWICEEDGIMPYEFVQPDDHSEDDACEPEEDRTRRPSHDNGADQETFSREETHHCRDTDAENGGMHDQREHNHEDDDAPPPRTESSTLHWRFPPPLYGESCEGEAACSGAESVEEEDDEQEE